MTPEVLGAIEARAAAAGEPEGRSTDEVSRWVVAAYRSSLDVPALLAALGEAEAEVERLRTSATDGPTWDVVMLRSANVDLLARAEAAEAEVEVAREELRDATREILRLRESSNPADLAENLRLMAKVARVEALRAKANAVWDGMVPTGNLRDALEGGTP